MIVKLEEREFELKANGAFMKKYQDTFHENVIQALYKSMQEKDILTCAQLTYCAIQTDMTFDEWIDSFETPLFILKEMDNIHAFLIRSIEPTVKPTQSKEETDSSKKNI